MNTRGWDRQLWGVQFTGSRDDDAPMLIGAAWASERCGDPSPGEPTHALLFCTRAQARTWCSEKLLTWREGRQKDDIVMKWKVRPVRVRETVAMKP